MSKIEVKVGDNNKFNGTFVAAEKIEDSFNFSPKLNKEHVYSKHQGRQVLSGHDLQEIVDALLDAFRDRHVLTQMVRIQLDENLEELTCNGNLQQTTFELAEWANAQGRLLQLIEGAAAMNPQNINIRKLIEKYAPTQ